MEVKSPSIEVSQKMTAGKRALAARSPVAQILRDNGLVEPSPSKKRTPQKSGVKSPIPRKTDTGSALISKKKIYKSADGKTNKHEQVLKEEEGKVVPEKPIATSGKAMKKRKGKLIKDKELDKAEDEAVRTPAINKKEENVKQAETNGKIEGTPMKRKSKVRKDKKSNGSEDDTTPDGAKVKDSKVLLKQKRKLATDEASTKSNKMKKEKEDLEQQSPAKRVRFSAQESLASSASVLDGLRAKRKARKLNRAKSVTAKAGKDEADLPGDPSRVVYLGHIPHGFYERQIRGYFGQFGKVTQMRLSRSPRTGGSRGFAFIEFEHAEVAAKAAEAMDGYMMHGRRLKASVMKGKLHARTFAGSRRRFEKVDWALRRRAATVKKSQQPNGVVLANRAISKTHNQRLQRLKELGLTYKMPKIASN